MTAKMSPAVNGTGHDAELEGAEYDCDKREVDRSPTALPLLITFPFRHTASSHGQPMAPQNHKASDDLS